jgi:CRP/FNR family transcriptional activator FtrB
MRAHEIEEIGRLNLFAAMAPEHFDRLIRGAYVQNFPPQIDLIHEGGSADFLHVLVEGMVEMYAGWKERETTMAIIRPVSTFILAASVRDAPYLMSARTLEPSRIVLLPSADMRAVFDADNAFARAVVTELASCYRGVVRHAKDLKLRVSLERLANYLLRQSNRAGGHAFELQVEKRKIAAYLGMTPENMSRALKTLQDYGVTVEGVSVTITDMVRLQKFAQPSALIDGTTDGFGN